MENKIKKQDKNLVNHVLDNIDKNSKKGNVLLTISIASFVVLFLSVFVVFLVLRLSMPKTALECTIDPIIVSNYGENHLESARVFTFGRDSNEKTYNTNIETKLTNSQYMIYAYKFNNKGKTDVALKLDLTMQTKENVLITFIDDGTEKEYHDGVILNVIISPDEKINFKVIMRIDNSDNDATAKGKFVLNLEEKRG